MTPVRTPMSQPTSTIRLPSLGARLLVLGDPHGDTVAVDLVLEERRPGDVVVCAGDVIGYVDGPASAALITKLAREGVRSVRGNHEQWAARDGQLAVVANRTADRRLPPEALVWMASLPYQLEVQDPDGQATIAVVLHSVRTPTWDDVRAENVRRLLAMTGPGRIVIVGHSHCPRVLVPGADGRYVERLFDFTKTDDLVMSVPAVGPLIVDAGSLGRPRASFVSQEQLQYGTYAVVDVAAGTVSLKRIQK